MNALLLPLYLRMDFCRPLQPIGARLPGLFEAPVLEYPR